MMDVLSFRVNVGVSNSSMEALGGQYALYMYMPFTLTQVNSAFCTCGISSQVREFVLSRHNCHVYIAVPQSLREYVLFRLAVL